MHFHARRRAWLLDCEGRGKVVDQVLDNFEVMVQIRVGGLPPICKHRKEW